MMKKYNIPDSASKIFLNQKRSELLDYLEKIDNLKSVVINIQFDINSPILAKIVGPVCDALGLDFTCLYLGNFSLPENIWALYKNIHHIPKELVDVSKFSHSELVSIHRALALDFCQQKEGCVFIDSINKIQKDLSLYQPIGYLPLGNSYGNVLFQIFEDELKDYIPLLVNSSDILSPISQLDYEKIATLELVRIGNSYTDNEQFILNIIKRNQQLKQINN